MNVRLENIHTETLPSYVSFLNKPQRSRSDRDSIHSVSSVRSVLSGMSALWSSLGLASKDSSKSEKAKAAIEADLKYLYSAFTKIPCLRLAPDHRARLIRGYEEFPFDTAVPLHSFKNLSSLEVIDMDFRSFFGWDRLSEQLRSLTVTRANLEDPADLLTGIVLDDMDKRRRRSSKTQPSPVFGWNGRRSEFPNSISAPGSPVPDMPFGASASPQAAPMMRVRSEGGKGRARTGSISPTRPTTSSKQWGSRQSRGTYSRIRRAGSGSSDCSDSSGRNGSSSNLLTDFLPPSKWRFLRHLGLPDNSLTSISETSLAPVSDTLQSIDLSSNLFTEVPDSLASLVALRSVNLSNCMIESLHSLSRNPLPAITALNLRGNRLRSLAGIERLPSLERLDLRDNNLTDPMEIARLTSLPEIREIWVSGNPFVKTHPGYRVVIFNLFRRFPGYSEDILIDGSGPGYAERKQLIDRVAEPQGAPVVRPALPDTATVINKPSSSLTQGATTTKPTRPSLPPSELEVEPGRRKKSHRPNIANSLLETSTLDSLISPPTAVSPIPPVKEIRFLPAKPLIMAPPGHPRVVDGDGHQVGPCNPQGPVKPYNNLDLPSAQQVRQASLVQPTVHTVDFNVGADLYRRKLVALKQEVGANWLTVVRDRPWESTQKDISLHRTSPKLVPPPPRIQTNCLTRASNQAILNGVST